MSDKRNDYISWDEYFMGVAMLSGMRSKDPNTQVGACIVSNDNKILSMGYNGFPTGCSDDEFPWTREGDPLDNKYLYSTHSELNAILNYRGGSLEGAKLYVTLFPCNECAKAIIQSGIRTVVYDSDKYEHTPSVIASKRMMDAAGVNTSCVSVLTDVRSGNAIIQNDKEGDNCILLYGGANQAITEAQVDAVMSHFEEGDFLVLQNEINNLPYIMEKAHEIGMKIVLNPSPMNEKILALPLAFVTYFMLNEVEAGQILGVDTKNGFEGEVLAKALIEKFPGSSIVLTMGSAGSVYVDEDKVVPQRVYRVKAVDTTAAGDTFTGFFIAAVSAGKPIKQALREASAAAALAVSAKGASVSIPERKTVEVFLADSKTAF